jgi:hypothetical protein
MRAANYSYYLIQIRWKAFPLLLKASHPSTKLEILLHLRKGIPKILTMWFSALPKNNKLSLTEQKPMAHIWAEQKPLLMQRLKK